MHANFRRRSLNKVCSCYSLVDRPAHSIVGECSMCVCILCSTPEPLCDGKRKEKFVSLSLPLSFGFSRRCKGRMHAPIRHMALRSFILKFQRASYRSLSPKTSKSNSFFCAAPVHRNHYTSLRARICIWDFWVHVLFFCEEEEEESIPPRQEEREQ